MKVWQIIHSGGFEPEEVKLLEAVFDARGVRSKATIRLKAPSVTRRESPWRRWS